MISIEKANLVVAEGDSPIASEPASPLEIILHGKNHILKVTYRSPLWKKLNPMIGLQALEPPGSTGRRLGRRKGYKLGNEAK